MRTLRAEIGAVTLPLQIDGVALASWDDLKAYLDEQTQVGQTARLTLWRDREEIEIAVALGQEPF